MKMSQKTATIYLALLAFTLTLSSAHARCPAASISKFSQRYELPSSIIPTAVQRFGCNNQLTDAKVSGNDNGGTKPIPFISDEGGHKTQKVASLQEHAPVKVMFNDGGNVHLSIRLNQADPDPADVYGMITADFDVGAPITQFDVKQSKPIRISKGNRFPLEEPAMVVPALASKLRIRASVNNGNSRNVIAHGNAVFNVKTSGYEAIVIEGYNGFIEVKVVWGNQTSN